MGWGGGIADSSGSRDRGQLDDGGLGGRAANGRTSGVAKGTGGGDPDKQFRAAAHAGTKAAGAKGGGNGVDPRI